MENILFLLNFHLYYKINSFIQYHIVNSVINSILKVFQKNEKLRYQLITIVL